MNGSVMNGSVMNGSVMNGSVMNVVGYERGRLWTWSVMNVVCYERVCYEWVCYERVLFWVVCYEWSVLNGSVLNGHLDTDVHYCYLQPKNNNFHLLFGSFNIIKIAYSIHSLNYNARVVSLCLCINKEGTPVVMQFEWNTEFVTLAALSSW